LVTQSLSFDAPIKSNNSSWGIGAFMTDLHSGGVEKSKYSHFSGTLTYAYNIPLKKINLKFGLSAQYSSLSFGADQFQWEDQINESMTGFVKPTAELQSRLTKNAIHASIGALAYNKRGFLGIAVHNVNEPTISFFENQNQKLERKILIHGGLVFNNLFKNAVFIPNFSYSIQGDVKSESVSANFKLSNIQLGIGGHHMSAYGHEAWAVSNYLGYRYDKYFIGYSTDWNLNFNFGSIPLTHEITIMVLLNQKEKRESVNPFPEM
jgi:type IX secretion system PorP/SprF family membrane protein